MKEKTRRNRNRKSGITTAVLVFLLLAGVALILYPTFSDWWNSFHQSRAIASYVETVIETDQEEMDRLLEEAEEYNRDLVRTGNRFSPEEEDISRYNAQLDLTGNGIMGYLQIPTIGVNLPIYHGVEESVLQTSIGHLIGSSLPVGGENTHAVVTGHRGLPSAKLLTDLDKLREGDIFTVTVLTRTMTYEVDQIRIVEPTDLSELGLISGGDYITLMTCTPYGINTHRLLVRGVRIENLPDHVAVNEDAILLPRMVVIPAVAIPMLFLFLLGELIYYGLRKPHRQAKRNAEMQWGDSTDEPETGQEDSPDGF